MASGLGKTLTTIFDLQQFLRQHPNAHILYLCDKESILAQSKVKFQDVFGEKHSYGMFTGNEKATEPVDFLFATFQTMRKYRDEFSPDTFDYIVVDEAHHTAAETYQPTADYFTPQFLLGLTATKNRMDGQDILDTYGEILYQMDIYDGWATGWLARVDYRIMLDDLNEEEFKKYIDPRASKQKVSLAQLNRTIFAPQRDADIVKSLREQSSDLDNPRIFIFCSSINHANAMAHQFGGEAAVIHSEQSANLNEAILSKFRSGEIRIVISVNMLNEGIDVPEADMVIFLRSTESSTIFFQQLGRGLRISTTKRTVRVLDYVVNLERISTILEMEETSKKRILPHPNISSPIDRPDPLVVNIPVTKFRVERVDVERMLHRIDKRRRWSKEEIVAYFQNLANELGKHSLAVKDFCDRPDAPQRETVKNLFGSCSEGIIAAGLKPEYPPRGTFDSEEELFAAAREYAAQLGHPETISQKDIDGNRDFPTWEYLKRTYVSIINFRRLAGFTNPGPIKKRSEKTWTKEEVDKAILEKSMALGGKTPTRKQLNADPNCPPVWHIKKFYGTVNDAFRALGLAVNADKTSRWAVTHENQRTEALVMQDELGRAPTMAEWDANPKTCRAHLLERRYGSYSKAMIAFGLTPNERHKPIKNGNKRVGDIENGDLTPKLVEWLQRIVEKNGKPIRVVDLKAKNGVPSASYFYDRGWNVSKINERINSRRILAKLAKENN